MGDKKVYIYKDRFTGDEMFAGAYPCSLVDDVAFCVEGKSVPMGGENFDVGCGSAFGGGGGEDDGPLDDSVEMVINIVAGHRLQATSFDKKGFVSWVKPYLARIRTALEASKPDRVAPFMKGSEVFIKRLLTSFSDYDFYVNESMDFEAGLAIRFYKEDGITPYFYFFRDGVLLCFPGFGKSTAKDALVPEATATKQGFII